MVKVVGCKPIGSPGVGSNPAHLKKKELMKNHKKNFITFFQTKFFFDVNIFASNNDHYKRLLIVHSFIYKNSFIFNVRNIPSSSIITNQKNFFNFLNSCVINNVQVTFFSHNLFKNMVKSLNFLFLFSNINCYSNLMRKTNVVVYLDDKFSNKINSKNEQILTNSLIIKPISLDTKVDFQIYYLLLDLSTDLNKYIYLNLIKSFLLISKQSIIKQQYKKYFYLKNMFLKLNK